MMTKNWKRVSLVCTAVLPLVAVGQLKADDENSKQTQRRVVVIERSPDGVEEDVEILAPAARYWLGIQCEVTEDGVSILEVVKGSPQLSPSARGGSTS